MDLGAFRRSRLGTSAWVVGPLLAVLVAFTAASRTMRTLERETVRRRRALAVIPVMSEGLERGSRALGMFGGDAVDEADAVRQLRADLNAVAQESDYVVNSLSVEPVAGGVRAGAIAAPAEAGVASDARAASGVLRAFQAEIKGEGTLAAVTGFLQGMQGATRLVCVTKLRIGASEAFPEPRYRSEFTLLWYASCRGGGQ